MSDGGLVSVVIPVYRDGVRAVAAAKAMLAQALPPGRGLEIVLVDDGSDDDTPALLATLGDPRVRVVTALRNQGRSAARNMGAAAARGDLVVFMDCDCVPSDGYLAAHVEALAKGAVASTGHVGGDGRGFWSRYQEEASSRRRRQHDAGLACAGSSQNLAVRREAFDVVGGFDTGYLQYGFEDRDLLLRMSKLGDVAWTDGARVSHQDALTLAQVAAKMAEAAQSSSRRFSERHPGAYRSLGYAALDARLRPWLRHPARVFAPLASQVARAFDASRAGDWLPHPLARWLVKAASAAAYLGGTARSA